MIVIDTRVWILVLNGVDHPKAERARAIIQGPEDIGVPEIVLEETLRGLKSDSQYCRVRDLLLSDFTYLDMRQSLFLRSAEIYRSSEGCLQFLYVLEIRRQEQVQALGRSAYSVEVDRHSSNENVPDAFYLQSP